MVVVAVVVFAVVCKTFRNIRAFLMLIQDFLHQHAGGARDKYEICHQIIHYFNYLTTIFIVITILYLSNSYGRA